MKLSSNKDKNLIVIIGLFFILLGIFCNERLISWLFNSDGKIESVVYRLLIYIFETSAVLIGIVAIIVRKKRKLFKCITCVLVFQMVVLAFLCLTEIYLRFRESEGTKEKPSVYKEFSKQYLHPFYYFFFSQDKHFIDQINNKVVSIDINGFRGDGPEKKNEKKLAFIVGGSAAFGYESTSNQTTISGYLNNIQPKYHFVNAAVPSWNSTQEFYRVSLQLLEYNPSLIIAYDGFNDAIISAHHGKLDYPPGTPESYEHLEKWIGDIRAEKAVGPFLINPRYKFQAFQQTNIYLTKVFHSIFSYLSRDSTFASIIIQDGERSIEHQDSKDRNLTQKTSQLADYRQKSADRYLRNLELMDNICKSYNCKFIAIWQPSLSQHKKFSYDETESWVMHQMQAVKEFHDYIFQGGKYTFSLFDFGDIFDQYYSQIQIEEEIFHGRVHLSDKGNEIIATEIVEILKKEDII